MRRYNFELFMPNTYEGLLADCIYYCWQHEQITDKECWELEHFLKDLYVENKEKLHTN